MTNESRIARDTALGHLIESPVAVFPYVLGKMRLPEAEPEECECVMCTGLQLARGVTVGNALVHCDISIPGCFSTASMNNR